MRAPQLDRIEIRIATRGGTRSVEAFTRAEWNGLAINRDARTRFWSVTHVASGRIVQTTANRSCAIRVATLIAPLGDWTRSYEETVADTALHDAAGIALYGAEAWARRKAS